ncbi:MAG: hypothetical protein ACKVHO_18075 [Verrucomicrobiia bacterium]|jgi:hypothetical protein
MKTLLSIICVAAIAATVTAQDSLPTEKARELARLLDSHRGDLANPPFKFDPDLQNAQGIAKDSNGMVIIPQKGLKQSDVAKAGSNMLPIAMLWCRNVAPVQKRSPIDVEKFRRVKVSERGQKIEVYAFFLGLATEEGGRQELRVYGAGAEPLLRSLIMTMPSRQDTPIEMAVFGDDTGATLMLSLLGKYQTELNISIAGETVAEGKASKP